MISYYIERRRFEWAMTVPMLLLSVTLLIWPKMLTDSSFQWILAVMPSEIIEAALIVIGWPRLIGLLLNGHTLWGYRVGPMIRAVTAALSAVVWSQFALALLHLSLEQGFPTPGLTFWGWFPVIEISVAYGALAGGNGRDTQSA